ncbi:MAG: hypothetical protein U9P90_03165 [Patescibacteria group bacterium]|nr:hypothetical protein [Patescibacteria group bacterium]
MRNKDLKREDMLKIIGEKVDSENFKAREPRPFNPRGRDKIKAKMEKCRNRASPCSRIRQCLIPT